VVLKRIASILAPAHQALNPVNQGDDKSHDVLLMLGVSAWFGSGSRRSMPWLRERSPCDATRGRRS
jgi:hypothetical protein